MKIIESMWNQKKQDDVSHRGYFTILNTGEVALTDCEAASVRG